MLARLRFFVLVALLFVMPLQGVAAAIGPLLCLASGKAHAHVAEHVHQGQGSGAHHHEHPGSLQHNSDGETGSGEFAGHLCCQLTVPTLPATAAGSLHADLPRYQSTLSLIATLHIPERPQRPPRAPDPVLK
jgi:hypothetical protein